MSARFILSLDCEGKWGVADVLTAHEHRSLTEARLRSAYASILALLDEFDVPASFAFVGLFGESRQSMQQLEPEIETLAERAPAYLRPALNDMREGSREGWDGAWAVESVAQARAGHEIALHGITHVPWGTVDTKFASDELALLPLLRPPVRQSRTFVYPRNDVAHVELLAPAGLVGYRLSAPRRSRAMSLASEFAILSPPEQDRAMSGGVYPIPAGYFVNWQHGLRRCVPRSVSRLRARQMLLRAERSQYLVHYWLHPENLASEPGTLDNLRDIVAMAARMRNAGRCEILTQLAYCERRCGGT